MLKLVLLISSFFISTSANEEEKYLFDNLFVNYNKRIRPVLNYSDAIEVQLGLGVKTIESFNQMEETISLNVWQRMNWVDEKLVWSSNMSDLSFISLDPNEIWTPDLELLNAATRPEIYTLKGGLYLYSDGSVIYSKPTILDFSCPLELAHFPFDTQICSLNISSWVYTDGMISLIPNLDSSKQIDVLDSFGHSEWDVKSYSVSPLKETRECCRDKEFDVLSYSFELQRFTHYYKISMGMTITLVIVSFIIMFMPPDNVSRTGTLVFIPLTILALQLTLSGKIPVVGYYTLMDYFFLLCFITSMMCSIESGLVYCLVTTKTPEFYNFMNRKFNLIENDSPEQNNDEEFITVIDELNNLCEESNTDSKSLDMVEEQRETIEVSDRTKSYSEGIRNRHIITVEEELPEKKSLREVFLEENNIQKVIHYDDKKLSLTKEQLRIDILINKKVAKIDNFYRIFLPILFFILIIVIMSYEN
jgi:hypothetical protein